MFKLMKYEFRKTRFTKLVLLAITAVAEALYLFGLYAQKDRIMVTSMFILVLLASFGVLAIGLESALTLHRDMNTKQSYMLFMTPNSSYSILGAKLLETGLSILLIGLFFFGLGVLDFSLLIANRSDVKSIWEVVQEFLYRINDSLRLDAKTIGVFLFSMLCSWILVISTIFLADVISTALLYGRKHNGLFSVLIFLILSWLTGVITQKLFGSINASMTRQLVEGVFELFLAGVMYYITAQLMERELSV